MSGSNAVTPFQYASPFKSCRLPPGNDDAGLEDGDFPPTDRATWTVKTDFNVESLKLIAHLVSNSDDVEIQHCLADFFGFLSIKEPADMKWFRTEDVEGYLFSPNADPGPLQNRLFAKHLTSIFEYTKHKDLVSNVTMDDIHDTLKTASSPSSNFSSDSFAKKTVPDLSSFTGAAEDFFRWKEDTQNTLGQAKLRSFLTDATLQSTHKIVAESVFYALKKALTGGNAKHKATVLADKDQFSPSVLWLQLITHYDTPLNRANVILYEIRRLFNLRLDASTQPDKFLEEFTDCLNRLTKNKAQLASDKDTLRALLLMAIQDREFDNVRNKIVSDPALDWDDILHKI